jgi:hypothetical protein
MPVWWVIGLAITSVMATIQTRIALGKNDEDYGWPFVNSENFKVAVAILDWVLAWFCVVGLITTL